MTRLCVVCCVFLRMWSSSCSWKAWSWLFLIITTTLVYFSGFLILFVVLFFPFFSGFVVRWSDHRRRRVRNDFGMRWYYSDSLFFSMCEFSCSFTILLSVSFQADHSLSFRSLRSRTLFGFTYQKWQIIFV